MDYGYTEWVMEKDTRKFERRFLTLPFQAILCMLSVNPVDGVWSEKAE